MLKLPIEAGIPQLPTGIFIGDKHDDLAHVVQLTASISELRSKGVQVLFLEAFYDGDAVHRSTGDLRAYLNGRNFNHIGGARPVGQQEHAIAYQDLIARCNRAGIAVAGIDQRAAPAAPSQPSQPSQTVGKQAFAKMAARMATSGVNKEWARTIRMQCATKGWSKFAVFGGNLHAAPLKGLLPGRLTAQMWNQQLRTYVDL